MISLMHDEVPEGDRVHPYNEGADQVVEAGEEIDRNAHQFLHFPWPDLDSLVGGIAPGNVWFVGAYSGHGKTTFLTSALDAWYEQGKKIYYMGLESRPYILRTHWACKRLGLDAGEVLSGGLNGRMDGKAIRESIKTELRNQLKGGAVPPVYFSSETFVDSAKLIRAGKQAADMGADVFIIDHIDHIRGAGNGGYDKSVSAVHTVLEMAQEYGLRVLAATQFNNEMIRGNRLGMHQSPSATAVYMGNHKRHVAAGMLGLYKPLKFDGLDPDILKAFAKGEAEPQQVVEPNVMAVSVMKHRLFGNREGKRTFLGVEHGKVVHLDSINHPHPGIRTRSDL